MPSIHPVALDSDIQFLRSSNMVKILIGTCVDAANTCHVCPFSLCNFHESYASNFVVGKDGSKPCHCYTCKSRDICKSRERVSKVWLHSQLHGWLDQLLQLHVSRASKPAQTSSTIWATQGKTWSLYLIIFVFVANRYQWNTENFFDVVMAM